ncbi:helix-turn-helix domain-containing protein [Qipengyuania thermophila]|uniref:helix-turn-helix domain-containing protein n=1 Tax=Qipengyuania thermophila TaxID=2509361 RepID=UPI0013EA6246|nr:helix-turn-helix transcriptional regulator [Qipengyuania thermophila]
MAGPYFKAWRKHRLLTQEQVVNRLAVFDDDKLPMTTASLSRLENGKQPYSQRIVEALAEVYQCEAHELIGRDPGKEGEIIDLLSRLSDAHKRQARVIIEALLRDTA